MSTSWGMLRARWVSWYSPPAWLISGMKAIGEPKGLKPISEGAPGGGCRLKIPKLRSPPAWEEDTVTIPICDLSGQLSPERLDSNGELRLTWKRACEHCGTAEGFSIRPG